MQVSRRGAAGVLAAAAAALLNAGAATAATPVQGSIAGPVTSVKGTTFTVKTTLSPTGSSKVSLGSKTTITEQLAGTRADLRKGACVGATGTKKGSTVVATRVTITPASGGQCGFAFGRRPGGNRPAGSPPSGNQRPGARNGGGFTRPANFGFAFGTISAVSGSTLTVKAQTGSTRVTLSATVRIDKTAAVKASAIATKLCAFVRGTSSDKGVTVQAQNISLSKPVGGNCTGRFRGGP